MFASSSGIGDQPNGDLASHPVAASLTPTELYANFMLLFH